MPQTLSYRKGDTLPLILDPRDEADAQVTGTMELRFTVAGACVPLPCTKVAEGYSADLSSLDLPARVYPVGVWMDRDGWEHVADLVINVQGGC
ncbi:hypothetical protein DRW48_10565 [Paracoccus suum]|uniref:Uncharacterized protein n=1 Tax=Paracoccus suum TaxID=2259340 RepID=A0A344PL22_9RHOB|nr:hypothetical protein [Paracoccus suum]AXC50077.1 hypothetical protein DRW48_10565 [Paracoccus suum]